MTASVRTSREALKVRILDLLDSAGKAMTSWEIRSALQLIVLSDDSVRRALAELVKTNEVSRRKVGKEAATFGTEET